MISATQRPLPDNTHHSQETDIHATGGIRTHNPNKRAAADPCLSPRGHWDPFIQLLHWNRESPNHSALYKLRTETFFMCPTNPLCHKIWYLLLNCEYSTSEIWLDFYRLGVTKQIKSRSHPNLYYTHPTGKNSHRGTKVFPNYLQRSAIKLYLKFGHFTKITTVFKVKLIWKYVHISNVKSNPQYFHVGLSG